MSIAKVTLVQKSMKDGVCEKCRVELPKGSPYRWFKVGFRSRYKHVRCTSSACNPRYSELESSSKSNLYAAVEDFESNEFEEIDDVQAAWDELVGAFDEYASEARDALDSWENGNAMLEERAEAAEEAHGEVEGHYLPTEPDEDEEDPTEWLASVVSEAAEVASGAIGNLP